MIINKLSFLISDVEKKVRLFLIKESTAFLSLLISIFDPIQFFIKKICFFESISCIPVIRIFKRSFEKKRSLVAISFLHRVQKAQQQWILSIFRIAVSTPFHFYFTLK